MSVSGASLAAVQDPLPDLGPPELPGAVQAMPLEVWVWALWVLAAGVLVWLTIVKLQESAAARRRQLSKAALTSLALRSPEEILQRLRSGLPNLSEDQQMEARAISGLLRIVCGRRCGFDLASATEEQLLHRMQVADPQNPIDAEQASLVGALHFTSGILYVGIRPSSLEWKAQLQEVQRWMQCDSEPSDPEANQPEAGS